MSFRRYIIIPAMVVARLAFAQDTASAPVDTSYVEESESPISLPLGVGLRTPAYDRVNGASIPWGPRIQLGEEMLLIDPIVTYRSNLGDWDPSLEIVAKPGYANEFKIYVGRSTFSNDNWIRSDIVNSLAALGVGSDARNYYRADRAVARYTRSLTTTALTFTPYAFGNIENDWSTGSLAPVKTPWSFYGRKDGLRMRRPNPPAVKRHIGSFGGGTGVEYFREGVDVQLDVGVEHALSGSDPACLASPGGLICGAPQPGFTQTTVDSRAEFPTFGKQSFLFRGHALVGDASGIPQRYGYLGGAGTLATVNLLAIGGDRLLYVEGEYRIPVRLVQLPFLGSPYLALRYAAGNAGVGGLPALIQNVGPALGMGFLRVDYAIDPSSNRSPFSRRSAVTFGISLDF